MFGSGASHAIYAIFIAQSAAMNNGRKIGLLRGAGTQFATWFYAMVRVLRLKPVLLATVHNVEFRKLTLPRRARLASRDVVNAGYFKAMYILLRSVFSALRLLCYSDSNTPALDKAGFLTHRTSVAIEKSVDLLNDSELFLEGEDGEEQEFKDEVEAVFGDEEA